MKHVSRIRVLACQSPSCMADENGCNSSGCKRPTWTWMYHDDFLERFGRCPTQCGKKDESPMMQHIELADGFGELHTTRAIELVANRLEGILKDAGVEGFVSYMFGFWYVTCPVATDLPKAMAAFTARLALPCETPT